MIDTTFLSRFTPSTMSPEALEAIFVKREPLAKRITDLIRDGALTRSKHHTLLVGPRGIGKTHFVSLVYYRVRAMDDLRDRLVIAWLREEEWGIASWLDLLLTILRVLSADLPNDALADQVEALYELPPAEAERAATALLKATVGARTLLIIAENLNEIFKGIDDGGQKKWRSFLQENPFSTILATSQSLFDGVSLQTSPFYGFFRVEHLQPLTLDEAVELLAKIARYRGDTALANRLGTPIGRARVQAVEHLACSNPRVYVIFAQFISYDSLDELVEPVLRTLDDLTPFYQSRMSLLSSQLRKIVDLLSECRHPVQVAEIARRCFITSQTASGQLAKLREWGYVHMLTLGRESYYEIHEPLMRLCAEVKKQRGEPIRLFVEFLRLWYSRAELEQRVETLRPGAQVEREYLLRALQVDEEQQRRLADYSQVQPQPPWAEVRSSTERPSVDRTIGRESAGSKARRERDRTSRSSRRRGNGLAVREQAIELAADDAVHWYGKGVDLSNLGRYEEAVAALERAIELKPHDAGNWRGKGFALSRLKRYEEALAAFERAVELAPDDAATWYGKGAALGNLGKHEEALAAFERAVELAPDGAANWYGKGRALGNLGQHEEALVAFERAVELAPDHAATWRSKSAALSALERLDEALAVDERAIELAPNDAANWHYKGIDLGSLGRWAEALPALERAIELAPDDAGIWHVTGITLSGLARHEEALAAYDRAVELAPDDAANWRSKGMALRNLGRLEKALAAYERAVELAPGEAAHWSGKSMALSALGRDEEALAALAPAIRLAPDNPANWRSKSMALRNLGRLEEALAAYERATDLAPGEAINWSGKGIALASLGRLEEALVAFERATDLAPGEAINWSGMGMALSDMGRWDEALVAFERAIDLAPDEAINWRGKGVSLGRLGHHEDALTVLERVTELAPHRAANWSNRGIALGRLGRHEEALAAYERAIELAPDNADSWYSRSIALRNLGRYGEALAAVESSIAAGAQLPGAFRLRAILLLASDRWDDAIAAIDETLQRFSADARTAGEPSTFLQYLIEAGEESSDMPTRIAALLATYGKHDALAVLGQGVVRSIAHLRSAEVKNTFREKWLRIWQQLAGDMAVMQVPLRLLGAAVHFLTTADRRALLELSLEERAIVQPLLGVEELPTKQ